MFVEGESSFSDYTSKSKYWVIQVVQNLVIESCKDYRGGGRERHTIKTKF